MVYDVPLLVEKSLQDQYDVVVVVDAGDDVRLHRLVDGRGMAADDARARMASQASRDVRLGRCPPGRSQRRRSEAAPRGGGPALVLAAQPAGAALSPGTLTRSLPGRRCPD